MSNIQAPFGQIPLPFSRFDHFSFEQYWPGVNQPVIDHLQQLVKEETDKCTFLWGEAGCGKSHLLQAICAQVATGKRVAYLPLQQHETLAPELLEGLEQMDLVCIDDVDAIAGNEIWELAIFNLFNRVYDIQKPMVFAAKMSPAGIPVQLPDLKSRLQWGVTFHLTSLNETERLQALQQRAKQRGFELPQEVMDYLSKRVARDMKSLFQLLDRLDEASLAAKKKLTVPFIKSLL